ncbi:3-hydroxyacyl-CoA dehydrogenase [Pelagophyceae sp. CCMP2097]|nr:3-hydroxyacyl-CoA dehydrogenase [Pelagophyceae sp. CCMP2097]
MRAAPGDVRRVAIVGTGVIGSGWAAVFVARGYDVVVYTRSTASKAKFLLSLDDAWAKLAARGLAPLETDAKALVTCVDSLAAALDGADYVQESVVETVALKQSVLKAIDALAPPHVLIGTSSSYLPRALCALRCSRHPGRVATVHPTLPSWDAFVEVLGSTPADTQWLAELFGPAGVKMDVISMRKPHYGHVHNALLSAVMQTSISMVHGGVAVQADVDVALVHLAKIILASGGMSGACVGLVGGGSAEAAQALFVDVTAGAPLAMTTSKVSAWCGDGPLVRCGLRGTQFLCGVFDNAVSRRLVLFVVQKMLRPSIAVFNSAARTAGSVDALRAKFATRMAHVERVGPAL